MYILLLWGDARTLVNTCISNIIKCNTGIIINLGQCTFENYKYVTINSTF